MFVYTCNVCIYMYMYVYVYMCMCMIGETGRWIDLSL